MWAFLSKERHETLLSLQSHMQAHAMWFLHISSISGVQISTNLLATSDLYSMQYTVLCPWLSLYLAGYYSQEQHKVPSTTLDTLANISEYYIGLHVLDIFF